MSDDHHNYVRKVFKGKKVWAAVDDDGNLAVENGRVAVKYSLDQDKVYRIHANNIDPIESWEPAKTPSKTPDAKSRANEPFEDGHPDAIHIYTDGASSGNPGPAGIGVFLRYGRHEKEISEYIGVATNNIAELKAIDAALASLKRTDLPVRIYTDSAYAQGVLFGKYKARENTALIAEIKKRIDLFADIRCYHVRGHSGHPENEKADQLATGAIKSHANPQSKR